MAVTQFVDRPRRRGVSYAAQYVAGASLDDLREVARKLDRDAEVAEVPQLGVLVVRYLNVPDNHPAHTDFEVVPDGHYLVYSRAFDLLYESDPETFAREHETSS